MRLLPVRPDHVGFGTARQQSASQGFRHRRCHERQHLPLRHLYPHSRRDQARVKRLRRPVMKHDRTALLPTETSLSRRTFLVTSAAVGGGLVLSLSLPFGNSEAAGSETFTPNAFIRIDSDGQVVLFFFKQKTAYEIDREIGRGGMATVYRA